MKYQQSELENLCQTFPNGVLAVLVYGPDAGHVNEVAMKISKSTVDDITDPFSVVEVGSDKAKQDPAFVIDAALAYSMIGGRRLVRIRNATDSITSIIEDIIQMESIEAKIILDAGALDTRSRLRSLFEKNEKLGILACYGDQGKTLESLIKNTFTGNNITFEPETMEYLTAHLGNDRQHTKNELEKLILMVGPNGHLSLDITSTSIGDSNLLIMDDIAFHTGDGNLHSLTLSLQRAEETGQNPITIFRAAINHFQRLHNISLMQEQGIPVSAAIKKLRPPVFWNKKAQFERQLNRWTVKQLEQALDRFFAGEQQCKTTGIPQMVMCSQVLIGVCLKGGAKK
mgnify:FL=1